MRRAIQYAAIILAMLTVAAADPGGIDSKWEKYGLAGLIIGWFAWRDYYVTRDLVAEMKANTKEINGVALQLAMLNKSNDKIAEDVEEISKPHRTAKG